MADDDLGAAEAALDDRLAAVVSRTGPIGGWDLLRLRVAVEELMDDETRHRYRERWVREGNQALDAVEKSLSRAVLLGGGPPGANGRPRGHSGPQRAVLDAATVGALCSNAATAAAAVGTLARARRRLSDHLADCHDRLADLETALTLVIGLLPGGVLALRYGMYSAEVGQEGEEAIARIVRKAAGGQLFDQGAPRRRPRR